MKTWIALSLAALVLATAPSFAGDARKKTVQTQVAGAHQQVSIKLLRLRMRVTVNQ